MSRPEDAFFQENERTAPSDSQRLVMDVGGLEAAGGWIPKVEAAYQSWGQLNSERSNAVLVCHALSGDANAAGWWPRLIGPGRAIDPARWFIIGSNALGGCQGTTGPGSLDAEGRRLGSRFPAISVEDMVEVQSRLLDELGIGRLALVIGGSMGGMQALEWSASRPDRVARCAAVASCRAHSAMQIGFNETARQAILRDPKWQGGDFPAGDPPRDGLAVARMLGHLSYLSDTAFTRKFGRDRTASPLYGQDGAPKFQVESYLAHQGGKFTSRFDAGSLVALSRAIDAYESGPFAPGPDYLILSWSSDWLYPTRQSEEIRDWALQAGARARHREIEAPFGHDSFLLDGQEQAAELAAFLDS